MFIPVRGVIEGQWFCLIDKDGKENISKKKLMMLFMYY